jgi:hypothetical protein
MALKPEVRKKIAALLKIKETDLEAATKDDKETDLTIPEDLEVLTKEELDTRDANQKKLGEKDGREIGIKEVKKAAGLPDDAPSKDPVKVAQAIVDKAVTDAKVKPDEKVSQLTEQVTLLQKQLGEKDAEITKEKTTAQQASMDRRILAAFPKDRASTLTDDEYITLIKSTHQFKEVDGKIIVEKDGKPLRDSKTTDPLPLADAVTSIFAERKWVGDAGGNPPPGGRGGNGGAPPAKYTSLTDIKKAFEGQGKSPLGEEFSAAVEAAAKDNPEFKME